MSPITRDRLGSLLMLAFVASLWIQRDYISPFGGMFPDATMTIMTIFVVVTLVLSFTRYATMPNITEAGDESPETATSKRRRVLVVVILLALWVWLYRPVGFALTGTLGFALIAWFLSDDRGSARTPLKAVGLGALITFVIYMVFDYFLLVPLPPGFLFD